jgi:hypothetical protein
MAVSLLAGRFEALLENRRDDTPVVARELAR